MKKFDINGHEVIAFHVEMSKEDMKATIADNQRVGIATALDLVESDAQVITTHGSRKGKVMDELFVLDQAEEHEDNIVIACHPRQCQEHYEVIGRPTNFVFSDYTGLIFTKYYDMSPNSSWYLVHRGRKFTYEEHLAIERELYS